MKIEHLAIWTRDLERMKEFYQEFFDLKANEKYHNPKKAFSSYFLSFENGARIELMHRPNMEPADDDPTSESDSKAGTKGPKSDSSSSLKPGLAHFAISIGSTDKVDALTEKIRAGGYTIIGEPRTTGDGYYESVIADPEGNWIELTI